MAGTGKIYAATRTSGEIFMRVGAKVQHLTADAEGKRVQGNARITRISLCCAPNENTLTVPHGGQRVFQKDEIAERYAVRWNFQRGETVENMRECLRKVHALGRVLSRSRKCQLVK